MEGHVRRAQQALQRLSRGLALRSAGGRASVVLEFTPELCAAAIEAAAQEQDSAEISDVRLTLSEQALAISARVKVRGRAWPPRPPVDTRVDLAIADVMVGSEGTGGKLMFRVQEPLNMSSGFAETLLSLLSIIVPGQQTLDALRRRNAVVSLDIAELVASARPDLALIAPLVRLHALSLNAVRLRAEVGINYA